VGASARRRDEDNYRWLNALNSVAEQRYRERDLDGLHDILGKYTTLLERFDDEPQLSTLETATAQCILLLATTYLDNLNFNECLELCADVKDIMECKAARYVSREMKPRPDSLVWSRLVAILADAKWKGPADIRDRVLDLDAMVHTYERAEVNMRDGLARHPREKRTHNSHIGSLACCGVQVIRALLRWQPADVSAVQQRFTARHGTILDDPKYPFFWDIRICHLYLSGCKDRQAYAVCFNNSRRAFSDTPFAVNDLRAYDHSSVKELDYLVRTAGKYSQLIEFPLTKTTADR
jgi:hypothetical protein